MTDRIESANKAIEKLSFKHPGIFANSLLENKTPTRVIRDIDPSEGFFTGTTIAEIDNDELNNAETIEELLYAGKDEVPDKWHKLSTVLSMDLSALEKKVNENPQTKEECRESIEQVIAKIKVLSKVCPLDEETRKKIDELESLGTASNDTASNDNRI